MPMNAARNVKPVFTFWSDVLFGWCSITVDNACHHPDLVPSRRLQAAFETAQVYARTCRRVEGCHTGATGIGAVAGHQSAGGSHGIAKALSGLFVVLRVVISMFMFGALNIVRYLREADRADTSMS